LNARRQLARDGARCTVSRPELRAVPVTRMRVTLVE